MTVIEAVQLLKLPQNASIQDIEYAYKSAYNEHLALLNSTKDKALALKYNLSIQRIYKAYLLLRGTYEKWYNEQLKNNTENYNTAYNTLYSEAFALYKLKDYTAAYPLLVKSASMGHPEAFWILGVMHGNGLGTEVNTNEAFHLYQMSSSKGSLNGKNNLGYYYLKGISVEQDYSKAFHCFEECSKNFHALGINNLAYMYDNGFHVNRDERYAYELYIKSSELGCPDAMHNLAFKYLYGSDKLSNYDKAFQLLRASSNMGHIPSYNTLGIMYEFGKGNIPIDLQQAIKLYKIAAFSGNADAKANLERLGVRVAVGYPTKGPSDAHP